MDLKSQAIQRIRLAAELSATYYQKPLLLAYSGGKDSEVCLELCRRAQVPLEVIHNLTTADAPETIYHVRKVFHQLELEGVACAFHRPRYRGKPTKYVGFDRPKRLAAHSETTVLLPSCKGGQHASSGCVTGRPFRRKSKQKGLSCGGAVGPQPRRSPTL